MINSLNNSPEESGAPESVWGDLMKEVKFAGDVQSEEEPTKNTESVELATETEEYQKLVGELTEQEAAQEYCDILLQLSLGFESAEGKTSRNATYDEEGRVFIRHASAAYDGEKDRVVAKLWQARTGQKFGFASDHPRGNVGPDGISHYDDPYLDREWSMGIADRIIQAESDWRKAGEDTTIEDEDALHAIGANDRKKLEEFEGGRFGAVRKTLRPGKHEMLTEAARQSATTPAERKTADADKRLQKALEEAYSPDYRYGHHSLDSNDPEYVESVNEEYNNKFFSPENKALIDRAIGLRRRLEAEGKL